MTVTATFCNQFAQGGFSSICSYFSASLAGPSASVTSSGVNNFNNASSGQTNAYNVANGNAVWVVVSFQEYEGSAFPTSIIDSTGVNTYNLVHKTAPSVNNSGVALYVADSVTGSSTLKVTVSFAQSTYFIVGVINITGQSATSVDEFSTGESAFGLGLVTDTVSAALSGEHVFLFYGIVANASVYGPIFITANGSTLLTSGGNPQDPGATLGIYYIIGASGSNNISGASGPVNQLQSEGVSAGDSIYVAVTSTPSTSISDLLGVTDDVGNIYTLKHTMLSLDTSPTCVLGLFVAENVLALTAEQNIYAITSGKGDGSCAIAIKIAGQATPSIDGISSGGTASSATTYTDTVNLTYANELIVLFVGCGGSVAYGNVTQSSSGGSTDVAVVTNQPSEGAGALGIWSLLPGSSGAQNISGTLSSTPSTQNVVYFSVSIFASGESPNHSQILVYRVH